MISAGSELQQHTSDFSIEIYVRQFDQGLSLQDLFGNCNPLEIEIGSGRGRFIVKSAQENPLVNYVGIERAAKFFRYMKEKAELAGVGNVRLVRAEAQYFIWGCVPPESVQAFHIYFPDPWPKTKHLRRRLINPEFLSVLRDRLVPGGSIHLATDFTQYFEHMQKSARACPGIEETYCRTIETEGADPETAATHYERRFYIHGLKIHRAGYIKK
jgi:tRNA (guanine-N7-)-methyltransferase